MNNNLKPNKMSNVNANTGRHHVRTTTNAEDSINSVCLQLNNGEIFSTRGLTKREYFAAMAMQGVLASEFEYDDVAKAALNFADNLIKELNKEK
jgi:hypothetical protein